MKSQSTTGLKATVVSPTIAAPRRAVVGVGESILSSIEHAMSRAGAVGARHMTINANPLVLLRLLIESQGRVYCVYDHAGVHAALIATPGVDSDMLYASW